MPSVSKSQQMLFGMALAVRRGKLKRSEIDKKVLNIVDGQMSTKEIEDFAKKLKRNTNESLKEYLINSI